MSEELFQARLAPGCWEKAFFRDRAGFSCLQRGFLLNQSSKHALCVYSFCECSPASGGFRGSKVEFGWPFLDCPQALSPFRALCCPALCQDHEMTGNHPRETKTSWGLDIFSLQTQLFALGSQCFRVHLLASNAALHVTRKCLCCLKPSSMWSFVTATLRNQHII